MAAQVVFANVGLGFDDDAAEPEAIQDPHQAHPEQCTGDGQGGAMRRIRAEGGEGIGKDNFTGDKQR